MRILVHEFESGGGRAGRRMAASLAREGAAMRAALLADLAAIPGVEVSATADPRVSPPTPPGVRVLPPVRGAGMAFRALAAEHDAVWPIAPETGGVLARLAAAVEQTPAKLIGPGSAAIRHASDKHELARSLAAHGMPAPLTVPLRCGDDPERVAERLGYPLVVKPARGAGCAGVVIARDVSELRAAVAVARVATGRGRLIAQRFLHGHAASVSLAGDGRRAVPLAINAQSIRAGMPCEYSGGETPLSHPMASLAANRAAAACAALGGLRGYIGVDVVLTADDAVVIEVNPRLTTAYLGVRAAVDVNVAALILAGCTGVLPASVPCARRRVRFDAAGSIAITEAAA